MRKILGRVRDECSQSTLCELWISQRICKLTKIKMKNTNKNKYYLVNILLEIDFFSFLIDKQRSQIWHLEQCLPHVEGKAQIDPLLKMNLSKTSMNFECLYCKNRL